MAFFSKFGNILRQTANMKINSGLSASNPSMFQALRFMSSSKLFIGGLSYNTDDTSLREAFCKYGDVIEARVIVDRETGRSRGFGFVTFTATDEASSAIQALDGQELHGRRVRVNYATDRARSGGFGGGGGGFGGGGFGGGGYEGGGGGGGFGGGGGGYGGGDSGGYGGGDRYSSGGGNYFSSGGNFNVSGGGGGSDNYVGGGAAGGSSGFAAGDGSSGFAAQPADGFGGGESFNRGDGAGEFSPDAVNDRDHDDEAGDDYANRRA